MFLVEEEGIPDDFPGQKVNIKELDDVLMRDVGNKIKESKKFVIFTFVDITILHNAPQYLYYN